MKHFCLISFILLPWFLFAQNTSGAITFVETVKLDIELPDADEEMLKMIPKEQSVTKVLFFNSDAALYTLKDETANNDLDISSSSDGNEFRFEIKQPKNILYTDLDKETTINLREFFGRDFLITGDATVHQWKLTGEKRRIGEFECQKAVLIDTAQVVAAWFTPQIPVQAGPAGYGMLPGMILEMDFDEGTRTIMVTDLEIRPVTKDEIAKPSKGKK
ncbi:MAG: GLPGLI family protein [Saprospiraceae bacterium]